MTGAPRELDLELHCDGLERVGGRIRDHWTFAGTHSGPDGTGRRVRFSGFETWTIGPDGSIADSVGRFDAAELARQLEHGVDPEAEA